MIFKTRVAGIPAQCRVTGYHPADPRPISSHQLSPPNDEWFEFELLDRRGYPARWLERKLNAQLEAELLAQFKERQEDLAA
jgi:hypothetical protein